MDFITGLPFSKSYTIIFVIIDWLFKYNHFMPLLTYFTSVTIVKVFIHKIVKLHGIPQTIVSDRDKVFIS